MSSLALRMAKSMTMAKAILPVYDTESHEKAGILKTLPLDLTTLSEISVPAILENVAKSKTPVLGGRLNVPDSGNICGGKIKGLMDAKEFMNEHYAPNYRRPAELPAPKVEVPLALPAPVEKTKTKTK